jgi:hypothetical protein
LELGIDANGNIGDVVTKLGTLGAISGSGLTRTATYTPNANTPQIFNYAPIFVNTGNFTDAAGNPGSGGTEITGFGSYVFVTSFISIDTATPELAITSSKPTLKAGETAVITFTFTEDPGTTFTWDGSAGDVVLSGGTLGAISGSGLTRTATFTPTANLASGNASITVASGTYTDAAGNLGEAGTLTDSGGNSISIDTLAPTLAITRSTPTLKAGETAVITFTFSEDPGSTFTWNGSAGDVVLNGGAGTLGAISGSGLTRTATYTPTANLASGYASLRVDSGTYTDSAGNPGGAGTLTDSGGNSISIYIDTLAPNQTVSAVDISTDSGLNTDFITNTAAQTITGTLSAALATGDTLFGSVNNGTSWTDITREVSDKAINWNNAALSGTSSIVFKLTDAVGNSGANTGSQAYVLDVTAPTLGTTIYSAPENGTSVATLAGSDANTITYSLSGAGADNSKFSLSSGGVLTLNTNKNFEAPGSGSGTNAYSLTINMLDAAGNSGNQAVTVNVTDVLENNAAGQSVIDLGIYGYLIDPVQVDGNNWYYYWDRSGDGTSANTGPLNGGVDYTESAVIYPLFTKDIWLSATAAATSDVYRYALMNGVKVALPTSGVPSSVNPASDPTYYQPMGTIIGSDPNVGSNAINATYNDLLAIWDAYNGTSTSMRGAALPSSWQVADYFSSTPFPGGADYWDVWMWDGGTGNHAGSGGAATYVALQVLDVGPEENVLILPPLTLS